MMFDPTLTAHDSRLADKYRRQRNRARMLAALLAVALVAAIVSRVNGADPLNEDYRAAANHSVRTDGNMLYLSMYGLTALERDIQSDGVAVACHHLSHAGLPLTPERITPSMIAVYVSQFDPFNKGWRKAIPKLTDPRFIGEQATAQVKFADGKVRSCQVVGSFDGGIFVNQNGVRHKVFNQFVVSQDTVEIPPWLDLGAGALMAERIDGNVWVMTAAEFCEQATRPPLYPIFRNHPKTLGEWLANRNQTATLSAYGEFGVYGATVETSGITGTVRGLELRGDGTFLSFDLNKYTPLTDERNTFKHPDRDCPFDGGEGFGPTDADAMDCVAWNAEEKFVEFVDPQIVNYNGPLWVGRACWDCHFQKRDGEESGGIVPFRHHGGVPRNYDVQEQARVDAYLANQERLQRDAQRLREDYSAALQAAVRRRDGTTIPPSEAIARLMQTVAYVTNDPVTPERACRELGLEVEEGFAGRMEAESKVFAGTDAQATLVHWFAGVSDDTLTDLSRGESVNYARFRASIPTALSHISHRRQFSIGAK